MMMSMRSHLFLDLLLAREREIAELKAKVTEVLAVMPSMNEPSQLGHNMSIGGDIGNHHHGNSGGGSGGSNSHGGLSSLSSLSNYLSTYPLSMADLGLSGSSSGSNHHQQQHHHQHLNLSDLSNLVGGGDPSSSSSSVMTPSSPLTPSMRPFTSKLFSSHTNGGLGHHIGDDLQKHHHHHQQQQQQNHHYHHHLHGHGLDPNATAYTPKKMGNGEL